LEMPRLPRLWSLWWLQDCWTVQSSHSSSIPLSAIHSI
jgi:hypothetical protein